MSTDDMVHDDANLDATTSAEIAGGFYLSAQRYPQRPALAVGGRVLSYEELCERSLRIAATIQAASDDGSDSVIGVLGYRSIGAYSGILGTLLAGRCYLPLSPLFPPERNRDALMRAQVKFLVVDRETAEFLSPILQGLDPPPLVILSGDDSGEGLPPSLSQVKLVEAGRLRAASEWSLPQLEPGHYAYLLFTSGSTGTPKGVAVNHGNLRSLLSNLHRIYPLTPEDRCSQFFELTFDGSVIDMFQTWSSGASLHVPSRKILMQPSRFILDNELTLWFSVPSVISFMGRFGVLRPRCFPGLRWSLFGGEALHADQAALWETAAPNSVLLNVYGPTEGTVECAHYRWDSTRSPAECEHGVAPLGFMNSNMDYLVVDEELQEVAPGERGELLIAGDQVTDGYWRDPQRTQLFFISLPGENRILFRTGDRVRRPLDPSSPLSYLGRIDYQVQIRGHRVELGELEEVTREVCGLDAVVAIAWPPRDDGTADGIELFVEGNQIEINTMFKHISQRLPEYMIPRHIHTMATLPRSAHGKFDRAALTLLLKENS